MSVFIKKDSLNIIGSGGHATVIIESAKRSGITNFFVFDDNEKKINSFLSGFEVKGPISSAICGPSIIAIGDNIIRKSVSLKLPKLNWVSIIHPSAIISEDVIIGEGTVIMAGVIVQPGTRIGNHCIINTGACIDHHCLIEDFVHIAPNCSLAGGISVREGTFIGIGSSIIPNITIGSWTNVGAGSVIISNQPDNCTTLGVPANPIKFNNG
jgi:sugar O-acyltransferase (sialic acid O-acetyltransferase NeuD family)